MPFLETNGCRLYYETHGQGPALVFAHGLGGSHLAWWQQVPHFRDRYTCVTFDHRGFGLSREAPGGPGPDAFVDDLAALVDHLSLADVRLVAQSMGGWTCLGYALRHPARVRALVLACTTGTLDDPETLALFRAHGAAAPEAAVAARGIHPACGERMAREQPALHFLYREMDALSHDLDKVAVRKKLVAMRTTPRAAVAALRDAGPVPHRRGGHRHPAGRRRGPRVDRPGRAPRAGARGGALRLLGARGDLQPAGGRVPGRAEARVTPPWPDFETVGAPDSPGHPRTGRRRRARPAPPRRRERRALRRSARDGSRAR